MTISHHSHSGQFCLHAKGTLEEVVQEAIRQGFTTFGLSEHVPRYRTRDLYPEEQEAGVDRLQDAFEAYMVEAHRLKRMYSDKITLLVGLETESITSESLDRLQELLERHGERIEYVVGSVHHCRQRPIDFDKQSYDALLQELQSEAAESLQPLLSSTSQLLDTDTIRQQAFASLFCQYFDDQFDMMHKIRPEVVGHFDLCRLYYPDVSFAQFDKVWEKIERNVRFAVSYGALFEVNAAAFRKGWNAAYPGIEVLDLILKLGGRLTLSDDSHGPDAVGLNYDRAYEYLRNRGVKELWYLAEANSKDGQGRSRGVVSCRVQGEPWLDKWPELFRRSRAYEKPGEHP
ncbi:hypothetical protein OIV83_000892 [Microbotryomycetes sp. JL201]|nr:hypothetical protein OIV83_000892 [Microbotryomycetes sp. JL201]